MPTIGEFLNKIATKSGILATDKHLVELLSKSELANHPMNEELVNAIDKALMTAEAATANPDVIKKIKSETLNGADAVIDKMLKNLGYSDEDVADIRNDKNTFSKIEKLVNKTKELESKKAGANNGKDQLAWQKEIDTLNGQIRGLKETGETAVKDLQNKHLNEITDFRLREMLASKKLSLPDDMPADLKTQTALMAIKNDLTVKGFKIVNNNGTLEVKKADDTDAYDASNRKIDLTGLIDGALAQNKLLAVNDPNPSPSPQRQQINGDEQPVNQLAIDTIDQSLKDLGLPVTQN